MGIDAAGGLGWVGIVISEAGFQAAFNAPQLEQLIADAERDGPVDSIAVDVPIGNIPVGGRVADKRAREFVGPRWPTYS